MYLRDIGSMQLLSREGEIAIAKRIEAGREAMIIAAPPVARSAEPLGINPGGAVSYRARISSSS
jgi:hypothetical protein